MKTALFLIIVCLGLGYGVAHWENSTYTRGWKNIAGVEENMDKVIKSISDPDAKKNGRIEVLGGTQLDFGVMKRGSRRSHKFVIKNVGEQSIDVWFKSSSCKCTVGKFEHAALEPNAQTDVELEWLVEGLDEFAQTATLGTSAREQEEIKLTIRGKVGSPLMFDPIMLSLGDFLSNDEAEYTARMFNLEEEPFEFKNAEITDSELAKKIIVELSPVRATKPGEFPSFESAKQVLDMKIKRLKGIASGNISTELRFRKAGDEGEEWVAFKISGRCVNPIRVIAGDSFNEETDTLDMGKATVQDGMKKTIMLAIKTADNPDAKISLKRISPESLSGQMKVTIGTPNVSKTQKIFPVTLEIPAGSKAIELNGSHGKDFGRVVFDTNMADSPEESIFVKLKME